MKRYIVLFFCLLAVPVAISAQNAKFGHLSPEEVMEQIPGFDTAQKAMTDYQTELQAEGQEMVSEFQAKQEEFQKNASSYSATILKVKEEELNKIYARIQEFSAKMEESINQKKYELLLPFQNKIIDAIKEVAKEENYTYIFSKSVLASYMQGNDITDMVKKKLGIQ